MDIAMKTLKVEDIISLSYETLMEAYRNGYKLEEFSNYNEIKKLDTSGKMLSLSTCPSTITQGTSHQVNVQALSGTPPYKFEFFSDSNLVTSWSNSSTSVQSFNNTFNDSIGTHVFKLRITDSCPTAPLVKEDSCTVNIVAAALSAGITINGNACPTSVPSGSCFTVAAAVSGGTAPYNYSWTWDGIPWGVGNVSTITNECPADEVATIGVTVTDNVGNTVSSTCQVTIGSGCPTLNVPTLTLPSNIIQGDNFTPVVSWSGGTSPYQVWIYEGTSNLVYDNGVRNITGTSISPTLSTSGWTVGNHNIYAIIGDSCSAGAKYLQSTNYTVSIDPVPCPALGTVTLTIS